MREPRPVRGARPPLFDRLVDREPALREESRPFRALDVEGVIRSVRLEISRLLNTRSSFRGRSEGLVAGSVLDFGLPDLSRYSPGNTAEVAAVTAQMEKRLAQFEPRLKQIRVSLLPSAASRTLLEGTIEAVLEVDQLLEPVSFSFQWERQTQGVLA